MEQSIEVILVHSRGPESPDLGEAQLGSESLVPGEGQEGVHSNQVQVGTKSRGLDEAQWGPEHNVQVIPR